jgi:uncharacterized protein with HEPN domain
MPRDVRAYLADIIDFRNQLTHAYPNVVDSIVWAIADRDVPILCEECRSLMASLENDD